MTDYFQEVHQAVINAIQAGNGDVAKVLTRLLVKVTRDE